MIQEIMIVTGEASGDLHGARLVQAMQSNRPGLKFCGMGGTELQAVGVEMLFDASKIAVVGFFEVISHLPDIFRAQMELRRRLAGGSVKLLILVDFPDFNLLLARKAKALGIPVFYYISPQVWAWRSGRVKTIGRLVDKIGVILPFEESFYRERGVQAYYVGHPLLDSVRTTLSRREFCGKFKIDDEKRLIGILPGSRLKEIRQLLPGFLEAALLFQNRSACKPVFLLPRAPTVSEADLMANGVEQYLGRLDIRIISGNRYDLMAACDAVIAASGTVTLELLLLDTPMVVAYRLAPLTYHLGTLLVDIKFFSLVNLIAGEEIVTELLQDSANPKRVSEELYHLVFDDEARQRMKSAFARQKTALGQSGASSRAASLALSLLN